MKVPRIHYSIMGYAFCHVGNRALGWVKTMDPRKVTCKRCAHLSRTVAMAKRQMAQEGRVQ